MAHNSDATYECSAKKSHRAISTARLNTLLRLHLLPINVIVYPETIEPAGPFEIKIVTDSKTEHYYHCRWTSVKRTFSQEGLRRVRKGICMAHEEEEAVG